MSEPQPGHIRDSGLLRYRWTICGRCNDGYWELASSKRRTCRMCRLGRKNNLD